MCFVSPAFLGYRIRHIFRHFFLTCHMWNQWTGSGAGVTGVHRSYVHTGTSRHTDRLMLVAYSKSKKSWKQQQITNQTFPVLNHFWSSSVSLSWSLYFWRFYYLLWCKESSGLLISGENKMIFPWFFFRIHPTLAIYRNNEYRTSSPWSGIK